LGDLGDFAAGFAYEVEVVVVAEVVEGGSVAHVGVLDDALAFEGFEDAVDGRLGNVGIVRFDGGGEVVGGDVAGAVEQGGDNDAALHGGPEPLGS
jgi:hypothetical protein